MKSALKAAMFFTLVGAGNLAVTQSLPTFTHVVLIVQENRTPDNLFGVATTSEASLLPSLGAGVDLARASQYYAGDTSAIEWCLGACFDPGHGPTSWHQQWNGSEPTYNSHLNPGRATSCVNKTKGTATKCNGQPVCVYPDTCTYQVPQFPQDTYVSAAYDMVNGQPALLPYFDIAHKYGFANYFYQTNEGPSQPAHDFLFGGTSAPAGSSGDPFGQYLTYFGAGNSPPQTPTGCTSSASMLLINPSAQFGPTLTTTCFEHRTLTDLLDNANPQLTWRYYARKLDDIWTAPNGIGHICLLQNGACAGFGNNVVKDLQGGGQSHSQILMDINSCALTSVSWVIPNGGWSDHPALSGNESSTAGEGGPNWVANIINAVGGKDATGKILNNCGYWSNTVVFVVWDDWGGFFDHAPLENALYEVNWPNCTLPWGCGYTYGFRVPFLVVSAYTPDGYVSGECGIQGYPPCPNKGNPSPGQYYQHDFGSILAFIENTFTLGIGCINNGNNPNCKNGGRGTYPFADYYAPELVQSGYTAVPLADFFGLPTAKGFEPIITTKSTFTTNYFLNYTGPWTDPDSDATDPQN